MDEEKVATINRLLQAHLQNEYIVSLAKDVPLKFEIIQGGHLNHVGRLKSSDGTKSCIVKVYMNYAKFLGPAMPLEIERCERENHASHLFLSLVPGCCPRSYFFDEVYNIGFLEDFPNHEEWGQVLRSHCDLQAGARIAAILVGVHSATHREKLTPDEFSRQRKKFRAFPKQVNFLCQAQFVKPLQANHRDFKPSCKEAVRLKVDEVIRDNIVIEASRMVREWMSVENGDCCIHGDLHLENIMFNKASGNILLIDTDCVRVGPEAYDLGLMVSNYVLLFHYHKELSRVQAGHNGPDHAQLKTDLLKLIQITISRYLDGMEQALQGKFKRQFVEHQILVFMAMEIIAWISGPASFDYIDAHPKVMLACLNTAMRILDRQNLPLDLEEFTQLLVSDL